MRAASALIALALAIAASPAAEEPKSIEIPVGRSVNVCSEGLAACPIQSSACDDPRIALVELGKAGAELKGVSPGTTLCGLVGSSGLRRVVRVTVVAPPPGGAKNPR